MLMDSLPVTVINFIVNSTLTNETVSMNVVQTLLLA